MNDNEIGRVAAAINQLRPDWPTASIRTLLQRPTLATRPRRDVALALTWVACDSTTQTPARILEAGPWWKAVAVEGNTTTGPKYHGWTEGDPRNICGICGYDKATCTSRARTNGHGFIPRSECLPPVERPTISVVKAELACMAEVIGGTRCNLPNGHGGDHAMTATPTQETR